MVIVSQQKVIVTVTVTVTVIVIVIVIVLLRKVLGVSQQKVIVIE